MPRKSTIILLPALAQNPPVAITSVAGANVGVDPASLTTASGMNLAMQSAAATAVRIVIPANFQSSVAAFRCVDTPGSCRAVPIDPGVDAPVYLSFYGTGISGRSSLSDVTVTIGGMSFPALYAGHQPQFPGLDQ